MRITRVLQVLGVAALAGTVAWSLTLLGAKGQVDPAPAGADAAQRVASVEIDDVLSGLQNANPGDQVSSSSNPFFIAANTPELDRIIALGTPAMDAAIKKIDSSPHNGLNEYLLAICVVRISQAQMEHAPGEPSYWDTGKGFSRAWKAHLARIPGAVRTVADGSSSPEKKNSDLVKLGTPAIPFVLDEIAAGRGELSPAAETLMAGTVEMAGASTRGIAKADWARDNGHRFGELRSMVVDAGR